MRVTKIGQEGHESSAIHSQLQQVTFNSIRGVLPDRAIEEACRRGGHDYRKRVLTPIVTVLHMMLAAIWPEESFQAGLHLLWANFTAVFPHLAGGKAPSSGAVSKARGRLPEAVWAGVVDYLSAETQRLSEAFAAWRGHRVVLADGACVSMPDEAALHDYFGRSRGRGGRRSYPLGRMVTLSLAHTMTVIAYALGRYRDAETALLRPLLSRLRRGDLLVADRHFAGANLYAVYQAAGLEFLTRAHQRLNIARLQRRVRDAGDDFVADLKVNPGHRRNDPTLPAKVRVRLIRTAVVARGRRRVLWLATSLLDAERYPAAPLAALYARRWRIETLFLQLKRRLSADVLRSKTPAGVRKELASCVAALNALRAVMLQAAQAHGIDPMRLSFVGTLRTLLIYAPLIAVAPAWKLPLLQEAMLAQIASHVLSERPGRHEPRAVRRELKHYPKLKATRDQWRRQCAA